MRRRLGNFLLIVGAFLIFLFVYSDWLQAPYYRYLLYGVITIVAGMILHGMAPKPAPPPDSGRFRMLKQRDKKPSK